jgi:hypothetical protein
VPAFPTKVKPSLDTKSAIGCVGRTDSGTQQRARPSPAPTRSDALKFGLVYGGSAPREGFTTPSGSLLDPHPGDLVLGDMRARICGKENLSNRAPRAADRGGLFRARRGRMGRYCFAPRQFILEQAMRKPSASIILSVLLAFSWIGFLTITPGTAQEAQSASKWRYMSADQEAELTKLGEEGWEAYAVTRADPVGRPTFYLKKSM